MIEKTVAILLSTYNGEKFLEKQLASLFSQTYWEHCTLYVRDDGSTDGTLEILEKYEKEGKLVLTKGENIGFVKSFFWLIKNVPYADYYSFCDQDDIWLPLKIERSVQKLEEKRNIYGDGILHKPILYFCDYKIIDENDNFIMNSEGVKNIYPFYMALLFNQCSGFLICFNNALRQKLSRIEPENGEYHDYWAYLIAQSFGEIIYDNTIYAMYRRHGNNESFMMKNSFLEKLKIVFSFNRIDSVLGPGKILCKHFYKIFYDELSCEDKKTISLFYEKNPANQFRKIFYHGKYFSSLLGDLYFRFLCFIWYI